MITTRLQNSSMNLTYDRIFQETLHSFFMHYRIRKFVLTNLLLFIIFTLSVRRVLLYNISLLISWIHMEFSLSISAEDYLTQPKVSNLSTNNDLKKRNTRRTRLCIYQLEPHYGELNKSILRPLPMQKCSGAKLLNKANLTQISHTPSAGFDLGSQKFVFRNWISFRRSEKKRSVSGGGGRTCCLILRNA